MAVVENPGSLAPRDTNTVLLLNRLDVSLRSPETNGLERFHSGVGGEAIETSWNRDLNSSVRSN